MSKIYLLLIAGLLGAGVAQAQNAPDSVIDRYKRGHQHNCVAAINRRLNASAHTLPFGYVENFCACMGQGLFDSMTVAQEREFSAGDADGLPPSIAARQDATREQCASSTTAMFATDS